MSTAAHPRLRIAATYFALLLAGITVP